MIGRLVSKANLRSNRPRWSVAVVIICLVFGTGIVFAGNREDDRTQMKEIRFAALSDIYPNISRKDGRMALELLMQKTMVQKAYPYSTKLLFIDLETGIVDAIQKGGYHFVTLSGIDYFKYHKATQLNPILIPSKIDQPTVRLLLLIGKDQSLSTLKNKEERTLIIESGASGDLSQIWLDTLLLGRGYPDSEKYFTTIRRVKKPGRAILPVFFNQADACIITQHALDAINALNPQINSQVKVIGQSKGLVRLMICATDVPTQKDIDILIRESTNMADNSEAQQAMTILQLKRIIRIKPENLAATEELLLHHRKITAQQTK